MLNAEREGLGAPVLGTLMACQFLSYAVECLFGMKFLMIL
jgi:hypothetical protein